MRILLASTAIAAMFAVEMVTAAPITIPAHFEKEGHVFSRREGPETYVFDAQGASLRVATGSLRMTFAGSRAGTAPEGLEKLNGKVNYLTGANPLNWKTGIESFARLRYRNIYPGISLEFHAAGENLEYDFALAPYASASAIRVCFSGVGQIHLDHSGDLMVASAAGLIRHRKPLAYQVIHGERRPVSVRFLLAANGDVQFAVGKHDRRTALVIDPVIVYDATASGTGFVSISAMAVDAQGNAYIAGNTTAPDLPVTTGSLPHQPAGNCSVGPAFSTTCQQMFVAKLNPDGADFAYLTYVGGSGSDLAHSVSLDASGSLYVGGSTTSQNFPTTTGAFQKNLIVTTCSIASRASVSSYPCSDGFALKLNPAGNGLVYSTLLGGSGDDQLTGIRVDAPGNAWLAGFTTSTDFPTTAGAFQTKLNGPSDGFVVRLNAGGTALLESTLLGGSGTDQIAALAIDAAGNAYVAGATNSTDFPVTAGVLQTTYGGGTDAFVAKFGPDSTTPVYATYYGGPNGEIVSDVQVDTNGDVYLGGSVSEGTTFLGTGLIVVGNPQAILAKIDPRGSSVLFKNTALSRIQSLAVDSQGRVTAVASGMFGNAPLSANALSTCSPGASFLLRLEADGQTVRYGSYAEIAGTGVSAPVSLVAMDASDGVYLATGGTVEKEDFSQDPSMAATCIIGFTEYFSDAIAPGEIISIYGRSLGPSAGLAASLDASGRLPFSLGEVTVTFDGVPAPLWYAQANQINTIVPFEIANRTSTKIEITYNGAATPAVTQPVRAASNIILTSNGQIIAVNQDGSLNSNAHPAQPGSIVTVFSSGGGQTNPPSVDGEIMKAADLLALPVQVLVGNGPQVSAEVLYAGSAPGQMAGIVQVNFVVPLNLPPSQIGAGYPNQDLSLAVGNQQGSTYAGAIFVSP